MSKWLNLLFLISLVACEIPESIKTLTDDQSKELSELQSELRLESEKLSACEVNSDCTTLGFEPRACGGFANHLVVSQRSNKDGTLSTKIPANDYYLFLSRLRSYQKRVREEAVDNGYVSTCEVIPAPIRSCEENKCVGRYTGLDMPLEN